MEYFVVNIDCLNCKRADQAISEKGTIIFLQIMPGGSAFNKLLFY